MSRQYDDARWERLAHDLCFKSERSMYEALYVEQGLSINEIAERLKVGSATINRRINLWKIPKKSRGGARRSADKRQALWYMDQRVICSVKNAYLADMTGCSYSMIYNYKRWKAGGSVGGYYLTATGSIDPVNDPTRRVQ